MGTGLKRSHPITALAIKGVVKEQRYDAYIIPVKLIKDVVGVEAAVITPHPGVVPPHYEVRAPIVLSHNGMKYGLLRPGITHGRGEDRQGYPVSWIIVLQ